MTVPLKSSPISKDWTTLVLYFSRCGNQVKWNCRKNKDNKKINAFVQFTRASYIGNSKIQSSLNIIMALGTLTYLNSSLSSYFVSYFEVYFTAFSYFFYFLSFYLVGVFSPLFSRSLFYGGKYLSFTFLYFCQKSCTIRPLIVFPPKHGIGCKKALHVNVYIL
jgi:hypothetical protein